MRVSAFVSGGLIPPALRGTQNSIRFHIVDFYATFCHLAGVDYHDDSPTPPLPIDPSDPSKDIYGNTSWPGVDGVVIWDMLLNPANYNTSSAHPTLVLSSEVLIQGDVKLLTSQRGDTRQGSDSTENTWQHPDGSWFFPSGWTQTCGFPVYSQKGVSMCVVWKLWWCFMLDVRACKLRFRWIGTSFYFTTFSLSPCPCPKNFEDSSESLPPGSLLQEA